MQKVVRRNCVFFLSAFQRGDTKGLKFQSGFQDWRPVCIPPAGFPARGFLFSDRRCLLRDSSYPHSDTGFRLNRKHCGYWQAFLHDLVTRELGRELALMIPRPNGNASEGAEAVPCPVFGMSCPGNAGLIVAARIAGAGLDRNGASA